MNFYYQVNKGRTNNYLLGVIFSVSINVYYMYMSFSFRMLKSIRIAYGETSFKNEIYVLMLMRCTNWWAAVSPHHQEDYSDYNTTQSEYIHVIVSTWCHTDFLFLEVFWTWTLFIYAICYNGIDGPDIQGFLKNIATYSMCFKFYFYNITAKFPIFFSFYVQYSHSLILWSYWMLLYANIFEMNVHWV